MTASSTCELIHRYITQHHSETSFNADVAQCIYTGIITDTGSFRFDSTSSDTIRIAADLMDMGAKPSLVYDNIFDQNRLERLQLLGHYLCNRMEVIFDGEVALSTLTAKDLKDHHVVTGDTEGFVNYGLSIEGVKMSALIVDRGVLVRCHSEAREIFRAMSLPLNISMVADIGMLQEEAAN